MVRFIHTLGPSGTNCEKAAQEWREEKGFLDAKIVLHETLEVALLEAKKEYSTSVVVGCVVYPELHGIVFNNLNDTALLDMFFSDTYEMVIAENRQQEINEYSVASHPAPKSLLEKIQLDSIVEATSNVNAAELCSEGKVKACLTTKIGALDRQLDIVESFGVVRMGFSVHGCKELHNSESFIGH